MKYFKILFTCVLLALFSNSNSQEIKLHPKFFTLHNAKFSLGAGLEASFGKSWIINSSTPENLKTIYEDPRVSNDQKAAPYGSYGFVFELYSANSIVGLLSGFNFSNFNIGVQSQTSITDMMEISRFEIPMYLKFRFGKVDGKSRVILFAGGLYSIPNSCEREQYINQSGGYSTIGYDESKDQIKSNFSLSGGLGYEFYVDGHKHFRIALYSKATYPNSNYLNPDYAQFKSSGNGVLSQYPGFDVREYRITIGVNFMFQFGEAMAEIIKTAIQPK